MQFLSLLTFISWSTWIVSLIALFAVLEFAADCEATFLPGAPRATADIHRVFLPPMRKMQCFTFAFDTLVAAFYVYQSPIWDGIKRKFPFF